MAVGSSPPDPPCMHAGKGRARAGVPCCHPPLLPKASPILLCSRALLCALIRDQPLRCRTHAHARQDRSGGPRPECSLSPVPTLLDCSPRPHPAPARFHVPVGTECLISVCGNPSLPCPRARVRRNTGRHGQAQAAVRHGGGDARSVHARNGSFCAARRVRDGLMRARICEGVAGGRAARAVACLLPQRFLAAGCACQRAPANYANLRVRRAQGTVPFVWKYVHMAWIERLHVEQLQKLTIAGKETGEYTAPLPVPKADRSTLPDCSYTPTNSLAVSVYHDLAQRNSVPEFVTVAGLQHVGLVTDAAVIPSRIYGGPETVPLLRAYDDNLRHTVTRCILCLSLVSGAVAPSAARPRWGR